LCPKPGKLGKLVETPPIDKTSAKGRGARHQKMGVRMNRQDREKAGKWSLSRHILTIETPACTPEATLDAELITLAGGILYFCGKYETTAAMAYQRLDQVGTE